MRIANEQDRENIISYLQKDVEHCIYMYIDIKTCEICSDMIKVWIQEQGEAYELIVMKYYDSFQIYSHLEQVDLHEAIELIEEYQISMISGPRRLIEQLEHLCYNYRAVYGEIFQCYGIYEEFQYEDVCNEVQLAKEKDAYEIAQLLCTDDEFAENYKVDVLAKQLADRIRQGCGRSCIIKRDGKIVAHAATFAEAEDVAVLSGSIVKKEYRKEDYFNRVSTYLNWILEKEGKRLFAFATNKKVRRWLNYCGRNCGQYGKLVKEYN